jgi:hypothetical protein
MNLQMDQLDNTLTTRPIETGWETSLEAYLNCWFEAIDDLDRQFGHCSVPSRTLTRSDGPEPLLTLCFAQSQNHPLAKVQIDYRLR